MKKSRWISFCGWLSLALVLFVVSAGLLGSGRPVALIPRSVAGVALFVALPAAGLWVLGSLLHRFRVGGAKMYAQAMMRAQQQASEPGCGVCHKRAAVTLCRTHRVLVCGQCLSSHNRPECAYADVSVWPSTLATTPAPRAVTPAPSQRKEGIG